jgi:hypothetical protein
MSQHLLLVDYDPKILRAFGLAAALQQAVEDGKVVELPIDEKLLSTVIPDDAHLEA